MLVCLWVFNNQMPEAFKKLIERSVYFQDTIFKAIILSNAFLLNPEYFLDKLLNKCKKTYD